MDAIHTHRNNHKANSMASKIPNAFWLLILGFSCIILIGNTKASDDDAREASPLRFCFSFIILVVHWNWLVHFITEPVIIMNSTRLLTCFGDTKASNTFYFVFFLHFVYMIILFAWLYPKVDMISCRPILFIWVTFQRVTSLHHLCTEACCNKFLAGGWHHKFVCWCFNCPQFITLDKHLGLTWYWILN